MLGREDPNKFPDFYHIGCLKTGTTSIQKNLSRDKRINIIRSRYFNNNFWYTDNYNYFKKNKVNIESDENIIIDYDKFSGLLTSLERIHRVKPDAKIILTIREQRDLLISAYKHHIITHKFSGSLEDFLNSSAGKRYITVVHYDNIYRIINTFFLKENIFILLFEKLKRDYVSFYKDLYKILEISFPENMYNIKTNQSYPDQFYIKLSSLLKYKLFCKEHLFSKLENIFWAKIIKLLKKYYQNKKNKSHITWGNNNFFNNLEQDFKYSNQQFFDLTAINISKYDYLMD